MPTLTAVEGDPFAAAAPAPSATTQAAAPAGGAAPRLVPVDHNPFATAGAPAAIPTVTVKSSRPTAPVEAQSGDVPSQQAQPTGNFFAGAKGPPPALAPIVQAAAAKYGVPLAVANWVGWHESGWRTDAVGQQTSTGTAKGPWQFMDGTAKEMGLADPHDFVTSTDAAMRYLRKLADKNGGDWTKAVEAYGTFSTGQGARRDAMAKEGFGQWSKTNRVARPMTNEWGISDDPEQFNEQPSDEPPHMMSGWERFGTGLMDPLVGGAQLATHLLPGDMSAGADRRVKAREADIAATTPNPDRVETTLDAQGRASHNNMGKAPGPDPLRMMGNAVSPPNLAGVAAGGPVIGGLLAGGMTGALSPVTGEKYWPEKAEQTTAGAIAGAATGGMGRVLGGAIRPELRPAARALSDEGVHLTPGQMGGGVIKRTEDIMGSIPLVGSVIRADQVRSIQSFNRTAINRSLADINGKLPANTAAGHDAIAEAERQFKAAYDSVIPSMRGIRDPAFVGDLNSIITRAQGRGLPPEYVDELRFAIQNEIINRFDANGHITGDLAQDIGTRLDGLINPMRVSHNPYSQDVGRALREADVALDNMMAAHNPSLQAAKDRIDAGWAKFKTVQYAARSAGANPDGTFTPSQLSRAVLARDRSKDKAAFARGDAMMQDLASAARDVLPKTVPDSGTPERAALMGVIGGAAHFEPHTAAALAGAALPYTGPVSRATNAYVRNQSPWRRAARRGITRSAPYAAPLATEETEEMFGLRPRDSGTEALSRE
jgi:hypothetical protein